MRTKKQLEEFLEQLKKMKENYTQEDNRFDMLQEQIETIEWVLK
jgi:F0F1-type ATP synthase beta subunit